MHNIPDYIEKIKDAISFELAESKGLRGVFESIGPDADRPQGTDRALADLRTEVLSCQKCALGKTRKNAVFGQGSADAGLMFIGEAPGHEEDLRGEPFVGKAGELLTKIIEAMTLRREEVFICNILKCRPPQNRNPLPDEILCCQNYLKLQIEYVRPRVICTLGKFSSQWLLKTETPITRLRGKFYDYQGIKVMPTFHPAYLLRNPADKRLVWSDMKQIMKILDL